MQTDAEVIAAIKGGVIQEHLYTNLELKESWSPDHGHKLSALSNKLSEPVVFMVIGVRDNGILVGKTSDWAKQTEEIISQHIHDPYHTHSRHRAADGRDA